MASTPIKGCTFPIAVSFTEKQGRFVVATRDIRRGEVLLVEEAYAAAVSDTYQQAVCHLCFRMYREGGSVLQCQYVTHRRIRNLPSALEPRTTRESLSVRPCHRPRASHRTALQLGPLHASTAGAAGWPITAASGA